MELLFALSIYPGFLTQHQHLNSAQWVICCFNKSVPFYFAFAYPRPASLPDCFDSGFPAFTALSALQGHKNTPEDWRGVTSSAVHWKIQNPSAGVAWNGCDFLGKENKLVKKVVEGEECQHLELTRSIFLRCVKGFGGLWGEAFPALQTPPLSQLLHLGTGHSFVFPSLFTSWIDA